MDQKRATYYTLNEVGGRMWELVVGGTTAAQTVEQLMSEYEVPQSQLEHDVATTVRQLIDRRLLVPGIPPEPIRIERRSQPAARVVMKAGAVKVPSVVWCGLLMAWLKGLLRIRGFLKTLEWIRRRTDPIPAAVETDLQTVQAVEYAVAMAAALYPGRAKCLEQSLTLYYLLRCQGVKVKFVMGVQVYPFGAHAWVEYRGEPVTDVAEHVDWYVPLPDVLP